MTQPGEAQGNGSLWGLPGPRGGPGCGQGFGGGAQLPGAPVEGRYSHRWSPQYHPSCSPGKTCHSWAQPFSSRAWRRASAPGRQGSSSPTSIQIEGGEPGPPRAPGRSGHAGRRRPRQTRVRRALSRPGWRGCAPRHAEQVGIAEGQRTAPCPPMGPPPPAPRAGRRCGRWRPRGAPGPARRTRPTASRPGRPGSSSSPVRPGGGRRWLPRGRRRRGAGWPPPLTRSHSTRRSAPPCRAADRPPGSGASARTAS